MTTLPAAVMTVTFALFWGSYHVALCQDAVSPTSDSVKSARESFRSIGGKLRSPEDSLGIYIFCLPSRAKDADLERIPFVPFRYSLDLSNTEVTDVGMNPLAQKKQPCVNRTQ